MARVWQGPKRRTPLELDGGWTDMILAANLAGIDAGVLHVGYLKSGPEDGWPVVLSHGFPFDVHAYGAMLETG